MIKTKYRYAELPCHHGNEVKLRKSQLAKQYDHLPAFSTNAIA